MEAKQTATQMQVKERQVSIGVSVYDLVRDGGDQWVGIASDIESKDEAEKIVRACNAHDELVKAAEESHRVISALLNRLSAAEKEAALIALAEKGMNHHAAFDAIAKAGAA